MRPVHLASLFVGHFRTRGSDWHARLCTTAVLVADSKTIAPEVHAMSGWPLGRYERQKEI